ncbi:SUMO ligase SizA [Coccidioides immitis RS]|uniref:SUMO ligase SizA n=1 Tax=Coccidioides immitis (strain RS) TaxID=246410 RepID=A0A0E1S0F1_COCIM|nr:SUMO ligase SizA [Coccidioides immitis RS]EAS37223.2 SUMO ligase SizA [Coccidioides immitis RS]
MPGVSEAEIQTVTGLIKSLLNAQLKSILRHEHLAVSGVKNVLQFRILNHLHRMSQNPVEFDRIRRYIYYVAQHPMPTAPTPSPSSFTQPPHSAPQPLPAHRPPYSTTMTPSHGVAIGRLSFKESPFFTILETLTPVVECKIRESTRETVELKVNFSEMMASRLQSEPDLRVMVYCAGDNGLNHYSRSDIAFPHQVELKVNLDDVKINLRGLKNKPGTTRPADITNFIRKKPGYTNYVSMTYALTQKKFFVVVNLVKKHSVDELVERLKRRTIITAEQVIREMKNKAADTDIVATSSVMSLKCPLSTLRITVPCRTVLCTHNQCFDATSFLQLQEQAPTWTCPVCNKSTSFEGLQIDQYVDNILKATSSDTDQVTIEPNGNWSNPEDKTIETQGPTPADDGDDDLVEIRDSRVLTLKQEPTPYSLPFQSSVTPTRSSREPSSVSSAPRPSTNKRPASQVIDLTGSDDEEPPRPSKRPAYNHNPSLNGFRRQSYDYRAGGNYGNTQSPLSNSYSSY